MDFCCSVLFTLEISAFEYVTFFSTGLCTYSADGWLYIARGYGMQNSGGYSIAVKEVSMADNAVYFDSELIGPKQGEAVNKLATYPYVVVKLEDAGQSVVFR